MPDSFSTSFIPKKTAGSDDGSAGVSFVGLYRAAGILVFVLSLLLVAGVFLYGRLIESSIERKEAQVARAREQFEPETIEDLARFDQRLQSAANLLGTHLAPTQLLELLESITLRTVRYQSMGYQESNGLHTLSLTGEGRSFASVALQSDELAESSFVADPIVSGLGLNEFGRVNFQVAANLTPSLFAYEPSGDVDTPPLEIPEDIPEGEPIEEQPTATDTDAGADTAPVPEEGLEEEPTQ